VRKLLAAKPPRLSRPLLETVAIIAYRQPITRPEIEQLRGVDCGGVLDTLVERRLVKIAGRKEAPGRPIMYETTAEFLELFGLKDLTGLPDLEELRLIETPREVPLFARDEGGAPVDPAEEVETIEDSTGVENMESTVASATDEASSSAKIGETTEPAPADDSAAANDAAIEASRSAHDSEPAHEDKASAAVPDDLPADEDPAKPDNHQ